MQMRSLKLFVLTAYLLGQVYAGSSSSGGSKWNFQHFKWNEPLTNQPGSYNAQVKAFALNGGGVRTAYEIQQVNPNLSIGTMVAANHGRVGGAVGGKKTIDADNVHAKHTGQEESITSSWMMGECVEKQNEKWGCYNNVFSQTVAHKWGFRNWKAAKDFDEKSDYLHTIQGVNYQKATADQMRDVWHVSNTDLMVPDTIKQNFTDKIAQGVDLFFVAGPNARAKNPPTDENDLKNKMQDGTEERPNTTDRTLNLECVPYPTDNGAVTAQKQELFKTKIEAALGAALDAMIAKKIEIVLVAKLSIGIYCPKAFSKHLTAKNDANWRKILDAALDKNNRRSNFKAVIIPNIPRDNKREAAELSRLQKFIQSL